MGYSKADKAQSHERIVRTAATRFREKGIDGISVADLMNEAGLTHGGFYRHFESREDLVAQAVACALAGGEGSVSCEFEAPQTELEKCVEIYLSEHHRDNPGGGCAMTALAADIARAGAPARDLYARHVDKLAGLFAAKMDQDIPAAERRADALFMVSALAGALSIARAVGDPQLSTEILEVARLRLINDFVRREVAAPAGED
jgi:TetR/AcrR family transcriptional regulator, transcriptional repressor for nem operon